MQLAEQIEKRGFGSKKSFSAFFSSTLFRMDDGSIFSLFISEQREKFVEFCDKYVPELHKRFKNEDWYKERLKDLV